MLTCDACWYIYEGNIGILEVSQPCPRLGCLGTIWDIDEMMLPAIILLNEKGYITQGCCSGHFHAPMDSNAYNSNSQAYISFANFLDATVFKTLPALFVREQGINGQVIIRRRFNDQDRYELHKEILQASADVLAWVQSLEAVGDNGGNSLSA